MPWSLYQFCVQYRVFYFTGSKAEVRDLQDSRAGQAAFNLLYYVFSFESAFLMIKAMVSSPEDSSLYWHSLGVAWDMSMTEATVEQKDPSDYGP